MSQPPLADPRVRVKVRTMGRGRVGARVRVRKMSLVDLDEAAKQGERSRVRSWASRDGGRLASIGSGLGLEQSGLGLGFGLPQRPLADPVALPLGLRGRWG